MNKEEIISVLSELYKITGFRTSIHSADFEEIAAFPTEHSPFCRAVSLISDERKKCVGCDREACLMALQRGGTYIYKCRYGLTEAVSPLYNFGRLTGFLMMGQVAESEEGARQAAKLLSSLRGREFPAEKISRVDAETTESFVKIMTICAKYLTMSKALPGAKPTIAELARGYIEDNIDKKIVISDICGAIKCSKSTLLTAFKKQYGVTINAYITDTKLEMAEKLLVEGEMTINEIASATGFSDQSYFSKVFSARYNIPPSEYRAKKHTEG